MPLGRFPDSLSVGAGLPVAMKVNGLDEPTVKLVLLTLVKTGATSTVAESELEVLLAVPAPPAVIWFATVPVSVPEMFTSIVSTG